MQLCNSISWLIFICLTPFFSVIVKLISSIILLNEFFSITGVAIKMEIRPCFSYQVNSCKNDKIFHRKHEPYAFQLSLIKLCWLNKYLMRKNVAKKLHFEKKHPNVGKKKQNIFLHIAFYNLTLKVDTSWAARVVWPILETTNANDVCMYIWRLHFSRHKVLIWSLTKSLIIELWLCPITLCWNKINNFDMLKHLYLNIILFCLSSYIMVNGCRYLYWGLLVNLYSELKTRGE